MLATNNAIKGSNKTKEGKLSKAEDRALEMYGLKQRFVQKSLLEEFE